MTRTWLGGLIVAVTIAGASPLHAQRAPNPERAAVVRIIESVAELIQAGNLAAVDTLYVPRGVHIIDGNRVSHGWAEYRDSILNPDIEQIHELRYRYYGVEAQVRESVAWASFRYELTGHAASGPGAVAAGADPADGARGAGGTVTRGRGSARRCGGAGLEGAGRAEVTAMPTWWNWQTHHLEGVAAQAV